ncbi:MAG: VWA domain-containing protein [Clostridiaceae bacterium]
MRFFRKKTAFILTFVFVISLFNFSLVHRAAAENTEYASKVDVMFLVDASKSMMASDPQGLSAEAMKMFIDMCHTKGDKGGMVAYSGNIVKEAPLIYLNSEADKTALKNTLTNLQLGNWTDIGLGLKRAVTAIKEGHDENNKPIIILLSDGKNDPQRSRTASQDDLAAGLNEAKFQNIPVYTIGLNADGTVDKNQLEYISNETGGKNFITNNANDLPQILRDIFAESSRLKISQHETITGTGDYQDVPINIPDSNIVESNITILSYYPVELSLTDYSGNAVAIPSEKVLYTKSTRYSMVKLVSPGKGTWILKVKGTAGDSIDISLISNYDLKTVMSVNPDKNIFKGDKVAVTAYIESNGQKLEDSEFISTLKATLYMKNLETGNINEIPMTGSANAFAAEVTIPDGKSYELISKIEGTGFSRESASKIIGAQNRAPVSSGKSGSIILWTKNINKINLAQYFKDEDGDKLTYKASSASLDVISMHVNKDTLELQAREWGSDKITVIADDGKGGKAERVLNVQILFLIYILPVVFALILILAAAGFAIKRKKDKEKILPIGKLMIQTKDVENGEVSKSWFVELGGFKHIFSIHNVLKSDPEYKDTGKIMLKAVEGQNLELINNSKCTIMSQGRTIEAKKGFTIKNNDIIEITLPSQKIIVVIKYYPWSSLLSVEQLFKETPNLTE